MGEIKKLKLTKSKDDISDIIEIEVNSNNIDDIINVLDNGFEKDGETFYINYHYDDNFNTLCEIIFDFGYKKLKITDNYTEIESFDYKKIMDYFDKFIVDIKLYDSDHNNGEELIKKFTNKLTEKANEKYGFLKEYGFEDKNFQINLEGKNFDDFYIEFTNFLRDILIDSNDFILKNKINTKNKDSEEMTIDYFKNFIEEKINKKEDVDKFIELFKQSNLKGNKDILKFAFEKRGPGFLKPLLNDKDINWELNENDIEDLFICACKNTCSNPKSVVKYFFDKFSGKIDINNPYKKMNYQKGETLLDNIIEKSDSLEEDDLVEILIRKLDLENLKLIKNENKLKVLLLSIIYNGDIDLFKDYYNSAITTINEEEINNYKHKCIKQFYIEGNSNTIEALKFIKMDKKNLSELLNDSILIDILDVELFNKILNSAENDFGYPTNLNNVEVIGQGKSQIKIKNRIIEYSDDTKKIVNCVKDEVFSNLEDGSEYKLYEVTYDNKGNQEIIYYEKNKNTKLAIIEIDKDGKLEFKSGKDGEKVSYNLVEINEILNDNYVDINGFDKKLSFLRYASIRNMENVNFKLNCKTAKDIVDISNKSKDGQEKDKVFICNLDVYKHNVQVAIINGEVTILNTGKDINNVITEIENSLNIKIKQIRTINQSCNNCDIASKLYMATLTTKCNQHSLNLKALFERLSKFEEFMENTLNIKDEEKQIKYIANEYNKEGVKEENNEILEVILETNIELLQKHKKHFLKVDENFEKFYNIVKKYKLTNINNIGNEINILQNQKNNNNKYERFTENVIKFYQINSNIKEKDESLIDKLNNGEKLLEFIKDGITGFNELNEQQKEIFKNIDDKISSGEENIFENCLEEFGKLQTNKIDFK